MPYLEKEINKDIYDNAQKHGGYLTNEDKLKVFDVCDLCGYGIYNAKAYKQDVGCDRYKRDTTTNEEWFCGLSTEEKAKTIVCLEVNALHKWKEGLVESDVDEIKRWLKEIHE